jgi:dienelactone hydrolase
MIPAEAIQHLLCTERLRASVIVLHGYSARAEVHLGDAAAFISEGTEVVLPDAPAHGHRDDGRLAHIAALPDDRRTAAIRDLARAWAAELPELYAWCRDRGAHRVGIVVISLGGFAALGALAAPSPFAAIAALLAAPTLVDRSAVTPGDPPLLIGLAGRDGSVPPEPGRHFANEYGAELLEYPDSEHMMRAEDWFDLWGRTAAFVRRHLDGG